MSLQSGSFLYPIDNLEVNVNDQVEVEWTSNFADRLQLTCYDGTVPSSGYSALYQYNINQNDSRAITLPMLEDDIKDFTKVVGCNLRFYGTNDDDDTIIDGASILVSSSATQAASIFALSSTVTYELITSSTDSPSGTGTGLPTTGSAPPPTPTSTGPIITSNAPNNSGLSTGAKAGIGAGVGVLALLLVAAAFLLYRNHRKMKDLNARLNYQAQTEQYKPAGVAVAPQGGNGYERPYSEATMVQSQAKYSPQGPPRELGM